MVLAKEEAFGRSSEEKAWSWVSSKIVWHQGGGITGGAWQLVATTLPNSSLSSLITLLISYTDISRRLSPSYYSSTLYYYVAHKVKAPGKKHSKSRAQLSAVTACSHKAARVTLRCIPPAQVRSAPCSHGLRRPKEPGKWAANEGNQEQSVHLAAGRHASLCKGWDLPALHRGCENPPNLLQNPTGDSKKLTVHQPREELRYVCSTGFHELSLHWPIGRINGILHLQTDFRKWG